jgi:hypothetical protein
VNLGKSARSVRGAKRAFLFAVPHEPAELRGVFRVGHMLAAPGCARAARADLKAGNVRRRPVDGVRELIDPRVVMAAELFEAIGERVQIDGGRSSRANL